MLFPQKHKFGAPVAAPGQTVATNSDLRQWIARAKEIGELKTLEGADPNLEISTIAQINAKNQGPALLFERIKGFEGSGFRVLTNSIGNVRLFNLTFGLPMEGGVRDAVERLRGKPNDWAAKASDFPLNYVSSGAVLENVRREKEVNLLDFPSPLWHDKDGGPFIGTGAAVFTRNPTSGKINSGCYRAQLFDKATVGINAEKGKHGNLDMKQYFDRNEKMPVVMVFGPDPLMYALAGSEVPTGVSELEYQGAITGKSLDVVKGSYTGLPIPANVEIAIEGFVSPGKTKLEGPHGEWTGYYASDAKEKPFVEVKAVYHRNEAILLGAAMSKGSYNDHALWRGVWKSALIYDEIVKNGLSNVKGVYAPAFGVGRQFIIVSIKQSYPGHATEAGYLASQTRSAAYMGKWVVVVDDDIDPCDLDDVFWAICARSDPAEVGIIKKAWASGVDPLRPKDVPAAEYTNSRGIILAVVPYERMGDFPDTCFASEEKRSESFKKWSPALGGRWRAD